jgi:predicted transcriptional regulator
MWIGLSRGILKILRLEGDDAMALGGDGPRHIRQRFRAAQADFGCLSAGHPLDKQLGADESHRANVSRNVDEEIHPALVRRGIFSGHDYTLLRRVKLSISESCKPKDREEQRMSEKQGFTEMLEMATELVAAHVGNNRVAIADLPGLIQDIYKTLLTVGTSQALPEKPKPAVPVKKSVFPDYIICLEDGKKLKMLKRHLKTAYNLTPEDYRERWGLPPDYPMVAPNYARHRSRLAKEIGLGTTRRSDERVADE